MFKGDYLKLVRTDNSIFSYLLTKSLDLTAMNQSTKHSVVSIKLRLLLSFIKIQADLKKLSQTLKVAI